MFRYYSVPRLVVRATLLSVVPLLALTSAVSRPSAHGLIRPDAVSRCSLNPRPFWPVGDSILFVGTSTGNAQTVGRGRFTIYSRADETRENIGSSITADEIAVERLPRSRSAQLPGDTKRILVVSWGYGPACGLTRPYSAPLKAGSRQLFYGVLRPRELWLGSVPVIDALPYSQPAVALADFESFFARVDSLPGDSAIRANPRRALQLIREWSAIRQLDSVSRFDDFAAMVFRSAQDALAREIRPEISGTYRISLMANASSDTIRTLVRLSATPTGLWWEPYVVAASVDRLETLASSRVQLRAAAASSESQLPRELPIAGDPYSEGVVAVALSAESRVSGAREWRASFDLFLPGVVALPSPAGSWIDADLVRNPRFLVFPLRLEPGVGRVQADSATFQLRSDGTMLINSTSAIVTDPRSWPYDSTRYLMWGERVSAQRY